MVARPPPGLSNRRNVDGHAWHLGLRSTYVVIYRYRDGRIARQELYYDPSGALERLGAAER
jgi:hypothetical protein